LQQITVAPSRTDAEALIWLDTRRRMKAGSGPTLEEFRHREEAWTRVVHLLASLGGEPAGTAFAGSFPGTAHESHVAADLAVLPDLRRRGIGTALYRELSAHARVHGKDSLVGEVMADDPGSLEWALRRGFEEIERQEALALDLSGCEREPGDVPLGIEIVTRAERPDLARQMYEVGLEAGRDIPGLDGTHEPTFEEWASFEIERPSRDPELCFIAVEGGRVVGFASLDVFPDNVFHGLTAVARPARRRGVGEALKRAQIAAAVARGYRRLLTESEHENEPMRRLNEKLGYAPEPRMSTIVLKGPLMD
jgi:GNAT superfamily N-acetyltransferase